ncbi:MAG: methyltransferase domain-containing protein [Acidobacteria bacterium]|nr:methyltransferase domain-containing protein [Acidobacteriota bacterium]
MGEDRYTHGHHDSVLRGHRWRTAENSASYLLPHLVAGQDVLDVGCGPGTITADLARRVSPGTVLGVDRSADVVNSAAMDFSADQYPNLRFRVEDVYHLGLDDESVDVVHAHQVLQHLTHPVAALEEMRRVTRPGGLLAVRDADYASFLWAPRDPWLDRWMQMYHEITRRNDAECDGGRFLPGWVASAGWNELDVSSSTWTFTTDEDRAWWAGQWADRVRLSSFADQAREYGVATDEDLDEMAAAFLRWRDAPGAIFVLTHVEVVARRLGN